MDEARHRKVRTVYVEFHEIILVKAEVEKTDYLFPETLFGERYLLQRSTKLLLG